MQATEKGLRPRRAIQDDEFKKAYHGIPGDELSQKLASDNRNIIKAVTKKYQGAIPEDDLESCGMSALWRALQYHREEFGQKFTTSLHRFTEWECQRELRRLYGSKDSPKIQFAQLFDQHLELAEETDEETVENLEHINECIELLPEEWMRKVVRQYFFDGLTMGAIGYANGYSKESARQKVKKAMELLKEICHKTLQHDGV